MNAVVPIKRSNLPVEYAEAIRNLVACLTIDEAKRWSDKADALAAWAKIYESNQAGIEARRLKLHAYRRMGQLARELRPGGGNPKTGLATIKGPVSLLEENGLKTHQANCSTALARMPAQKFAALVNSPRPPATSGALPLVRNGSEQWKIVSGTAGGRSSLMGFAAFCRQNSPKGLAKGLTDMERQKAKALVEPAMRWLSEFEKGIES